MALVLHLKYAEALRGRTDRLAKVSFRGVSHFTKIIEGADENAIFDETFEWPVARSIESDEYLDIQLFNYNKYLNNKLIGTFRVILQQLVEVGHLKVTDSLIDANNTVMKTTITFELVYNAPDGSVGNWQSGGFEEAYKIDQIDGRSSRQYGEEEMNLLNERHSDNDSLASSPTKSRRGSNNAVNLRRIFTNIVARWPGSCHDSHVFNTSAIGRHLEENHVGFVADGVLLGDSGYALRPYLMTPYLRPIGGPQERFNRVHKRTRSAIERTFGIFKRRFHILHSEIRTAPAKVCSVVCACAVLHNLAIRLNEPPFEEEPFEDDQPEVENQGPQTGNAVRQHIVDTYFNN